MNVRDVLERWSERGAIDNYALVALVFDESADPEFPYEVVDIVDVVTDPDDGTVNLVAAEDTDETPTLTVADARFILRDLVGAFGDAEVYVREEIPDVDGFWVALDSPVAATAVNDELREFAFVKWYDGCVEGAED